MSLGKARLLLATVRTAEPRDPSKPSRLSWQGRELASLGTKREAVQVGRS